MAATVKAKRRKKKKVALLIFEILILLLLAVVAFAATKFMKIQTSPLDNDNIHVNEDISEESQEIMNDYKTIALFGLDNRSTGELSTGRSDVIMIAAINSKTHEVKIASVYRDTYLDTGDGIYQKCNAAYAKGGPEQAISMLNKNLDLNITDHITVDFNAIVKCVDLLGGIEMTITDDEANLMIGYIREINEITGHNSVAPSSGGTYTLDGVQACAFARIRYGGGDDYKRTERQRAVLSAMVAKAQKSSLLTLNSLINEVLGDIETNLSATDIISLATKIFSYDMGETTGFPFKKATHTYDSVGDVVIPCDLATNVTTLHQFLYDDTNYTPSSTVQANSAQIINKTGFGANDGY
ncbi:MAG: LCP family protein [Roseburia sp.]|nr:LCP family protein [Roseburia sp.]